MQASEMADSNSWFMPYIDVKSVNGPETGETKIVTPVEKYHSRVRDVRYLADCTRPNLGLIVGKMSEENHAPTKRHWEMF